MRASPSGCARKATACRRAIRSSSSRPTRSISRSARRTAGVLSRIDRKDGDDVKVGEVLGVIDESRRGRPPPAPRRRRRRAEARSRRAKTGKAARDADRAEGGRAERGRSRARAGQRRCRPGDASATSSRRLTGRADGGRPRPTPAVPRGRAGTRQGAARHAGRRGAGDRRAIAPRSACACRSGARRLPSGWSRRRAPPRCSPPSTRST